MDCNESSRYMISLCVIGIVFVVIMGFLLIIPSVDGYSNHYDDVRNNQITQLWNLGNNLTEGDMLEYKICNDNIMYQEIYPYHCYNIKLTFISILESYKGDTWIVQGYFETPDRVEPVILLVNPYTFEITTDPLHVNLGESLESTIFSLNQYGEKSLSVGSIWDEIDSYFTNKINLEIKGKSILNIMNRTIQTSILSYDIIVPSEIHLNYDFPFPLKSTLYSPHIIFPAPKELHYFELINYEMSGIDYGDTSHTHDGLSEH